MSDVFLGIFVIIATLVVIASVCSVVGVVLDDYLDDDLKGGGKS